MEELTGEVFAAPIGTELPFRFDELKEAALSTVAGLDFGDVTEGFVSLGTLADDAATLGDMIGTALEEGDWAGEPIRLDTAPKSFTVQATVELDKDASLEARRTLARFCGLPIPTTAGINLYPDTERRAAHRAIRARHVLELVAGRRTTFLPDEPMPGVLVRKSVRHGGRRNGKGPAL